MGHKLEHSPGTQIMTVPTTDTHESSHDMDEETPEMISLDIFRASYSHHQQGTTMKKNFYIKDSGSISV